MITTTLIDCTDLTLEPISKWEQWTTHDERIRALGFAQCQKGILHLAGRKGLRMTIGRLLDLPSEQIALRLTPQGKPLLSSPVPSGWDFSLSSSWPFVFLGLSTSCPIGVDVESSTTNVDPLRVARRFFSPQEIRSLNQIEPHLQMDEFLNLWTQKEAVTKAVGKGLSLPLDFPVASLSASGPRPPHLDGEWQLFHTITDRRYHLAIALRDSPLSWHANDLLPPQNLELQSE